MITIRENVMKAVEQTGIPFEVMAIDPSLSDTAQFCSQYNIDVSNAANTILVVSKKEPKSYCACIVLATTKLDVNRKVKELLSSKASFASAEEMNAMTGMEVGAVTPFGLPSSIPIFMDEKVLEKEWVILGAGKRDTKIKIAPQAITKLPTVKIVPQLGILKDSN